MSTDLSGDKAKKKVDRLLDMIVESVDIVDRPANKRPFILFKREAGMADQKATVTETEEGIDVQVSDADAEAGTKGEKETDDKTRTKVAKEGEGEVEEEKKEKKPDEEEEEVEEEEKAKEGKPDEKEVEEEEEEEMKKAMIHGEVRDAVLPILKEVSEKTMSLISVLRAATTTESSISAPLPNVISKQLGDIRTTLMGLVEQYPSPAVKGEDGVEKAASTHEALLQEKLDAFNKLAQEIAAGGEAADMDAKFSQMREIFWSIEPIAVVTQVSKSDETPPSSDEVIKALLKQAADLVIPLPVRDAVVEKLGAFAETMLGTITKMKDAETTDEKLDTPLPAEFGKAITESLKALDGIAEKYPSPASKSSAILNELQMCFDGIKKIVTEALGSDMPVEPEVKDEEVEADATGEEGLTKADDRLSKLETTVAKIAKAVIPEDDKGEAGGETGGVPAPNAAEDTGKEPVAKKDRVSWSRDLAKDVSDEAAVEAEKDKD